MDLSMYRSIKMLHNFCSPKDQKRAKRPEAGSQPGRKFLDNDYAYVRLFESVLHYVVFILNEPAWIEMLELDERNPIEYMTSKRTMFDEDILYNHHDAEVGHFAVVGVEIFLDGTTEISIVCNNSSNNDIVKQKPITILPNIGATIL